MQTQLALSNPIRLATVVVLFMLFLGIGLGTGASEADILLPDPDVTGTLPVEEALAQRRSVRSYTDAPLSAEDIGQLLWAAQGITEPAHGFRTAPSAGATFPLELYLCVGNAEGLNKGLYRYHPRDHGLTLLKEDDLREELSEVALGQAWIAEAPVVLVMAADYARTTAVYGDRGRRYVHIEVGHVAQNVYLQAQALDLATVIVGAFDDQSAQDLLGIEHSVLAILPVGAPDG